LVSNPTIQEMGHQEDADDAGSDCEVDDSADAGDDLVAQDNTKIMVNETSHDFYHSQHGVRPEAQRGGNQRTINEQ